MSLGKLSMKSQSHRPAGVSSNIRRRLALRTEEIGYEKSED